MDFFILLLAWVYLALEWFYGTSATSSVGFVKILRLLRTLRPLRFIPKSPGLKRVVDTLLASIPAIGNVALITLMFWYMFGVVGVSLFKGQFHNCAIVHHHRPILFIQPDILTKDDCLNHPNTLWLSPVANFDNLYKACLTLFEISTLEGWVDVLYRAVDSNGVDKVPKTDNKPWVALFFILFITLGSFFIVNLFIGVLIDHYYRNKHDGAMLSSEQREWIAMQNLMLKFKPLGMGAIVQAPLSKSASTCKRGVHKVVTHKWFERGVLLLIGANGIVMTLEYHGQPYAMEVFLRTANLVFLALFTSELIVKLAVYGTRQFWRDRWNRYDAVVVLISIVGTPLSLTEGVGVTVFRILRLGRLFRAVKHSRGIRTLLSTLLLSLPSLGNITALLILLFFMYSVMGVNLFGRVRRGEFLTEHANFDNFALAFLTLFRMSTGEAWDGIMHDCMAQPPFCESQLGECGTVFAPLYFVTFLTIGMFVLLNLFLAIMLESFSDVVEAEKTKLKDIHITKFNNVWNEYDGQGTMTMRAYHLSSFLLDLGTPLGVNKWKDGGDLLAHLAALNIPMMDGKIFYYETLAALFKREFGCPLPMKIRDMFNDEWESRFTCPPESLNSALAIPCVRLLLFYKRVVRKKEERERNEREQQELLNRLTPVTGSDMRSPSVGGATMQLEAPLHDRPRKLSIASVFSHKSVQSASSGHSDDPSPKRKESVSLSTFIPRTLSMSARKFMGSSTTPTSSTTRD